MLTVQKLTKKYSKELAVNNISFLGCLFIYGGILTRRILGGGDNIIFTALMRIVILVIIITPAIVLLGALYTSSTGFTGVLVAYASFIFYNLIFSGLILFLGKGVFENIEL